MRPPEDRPEAPQPVDPLGVGASQQRTFLLWLLAQAWTPGLDVDPVEALNAYAAEVFDEGARSTGLNPYYSGTAIPAEET